ncbi:AbrB family transcriptional regulator [soil metagenome]
MIDRATATRTLTTLAIAAVGGTTFGLLGFPAGWMTGGMTAVAVVGMAKVPVEVPKPLQTVLFVLIGSILGTSVSPQLVSELRHWPISLAILFVNVLAVQRAVEFFLRRFYRWDRQTAFFAAIPGLTSYVLVLALPTRADISRIAVSQTIRVFLLVLLMPTMVAFVGRTAAAAVQPVAGPLDIVITLVAGAIGGLLMSYTSIPAAALIGAMLASGFLHGYGIVQGGLPLYVQAPVYIALGAMIGVRFSGTSLQTLASMLLPSFGAFAVSIAVAAVGAVATGLLVAVPMSQILLAFAPGGIEVMTAVAFALNLDAAFVAGHQLARFLAITIYTPILMRRIGGGGRSPPDAPT